MTLFIPDDRLKVLARKFYFGPYEEKKQKTSARKERSANSTGLLIDELKDCYILQNVPYQGALCTVSWSRRLLDKGAQHTQDEWIEILRGKKWKLPDAPLYHATLSALYQHKDGQQSKLVEKVLRVFSKSFKDTYLMTATNVAYALKGNDTVRHRLSGGEMPVAMVGLDNFVDASSGLEDEIDSLLGTRDLTEVENVYEWVSGKKPYLWRINSRPNSQTERAVVLGVYDCDGFDIDASVYINLSWPALGVVVGVPKIPPEMKVA